MLNQSNMNGFFLIDKDKGDTSFDVVRGIRKIIGEKKVGHSGTLDPLATGLLLVACGEGTKLLEYLIGCDKEYLVDAEFGFVSDTYDAEGRVIEQNTEIECLEEDLLRVINGAFLGNINQVPPKYSSLKIDGKRAYELVREGKDVVMKSREVRIDAFEVMKIEWPRVSFKVKCGSGTYIRSLVHDLGQELGCGAYVKELRRTMVGSFSVSGAVKLSVVSNKVDQYLISLEKVADMFKKCELSEREWLALQDGKTLLNKNVEHDSPVVAFYKSKVVGVLENVADGIKFAKRIFS